MFDSADEDMTPEDRTAELCRWFENAETQTAEERQRAERDRDYRDLIQWTKTEIDTLSGRGQPVLTIDYTGAKVDLVLGMERQRRSDPKAFPRTPKEQDRSDVATQSLRFIADDCQFDQSRSDVFDNILVEGYGGAKVTVEPSDDGGYDIKIVQIPWDRLFRDPNSRRADFSDAKFLGEVLWMDRDDAKEMFPDGGAALDATFSMGGTYGGTYDDRPQNWTDSKRARVRIVQMWYRDKGEWAVATFTKGGAVAPTQYSPYKDRYGRSACPLILRHAYCDRENNRYGMVRGMISLQDEVNKRRSKALHWANSRQLMIEEGAVDDYDKVRAEAAKPDGMIVYRRFGADGRGVEVMSSAEFTTAQMALLQHATAELQSRGPNASLAGKDGQDLSGRAIIAQQQGGAAEMEPLFDALRQWTRQVYEAAWMRVRQFWTAEKWVRVTDDDKNVQWVGLNRQITLEQELAAMPPEMQAQAMQSMGLVPGDPRLQQVVRTENAVGELDADITIEDGPNVQMLDSDQAALLAPLVQAGQLPAEVLIENMPVRNKAKIIKIMAEAKQAAAQAQQAQMQAAGQKAQADVAKTVAETENKQADTLNKQIEAEQNARGLMAQEMGVAPLPGEVVPEQQGIAA
jgi:hypothetical protein